MSNYKIKPLQWCFFVQHLYTHFTICPINVTTHSSIIVHILSTVGASRTENYQLVENVLDPIYPCLRILSIGKLLSGTLKGVVYSVTLVHDAFVDP
jgi:hypothetical protein